MKLLWDDVTTPVQTDRYALVIRTGVTQRVNNIMEVLRRTQPRIAVAIERGWADEAGRAVSSSMDAGDYPNVPEMLIMRFQAANRVIVFVLIFGIVLNGSRKGKLLQGEFRCVLVEAEEVGDALDRVFNLEKLLTPEAA